MVNSIYKLNELNCNLIWACKNGDIFRAKYLIEKGADINTSDRFDDTLLDVSIFYDDVYLVNFLFKNGVDINAKDRLGLTTLHRACFVDNAGIGAIKKIIEYGADVNAKDKNGDTALHLSIVYNKFNIAKSLIECRANAYVPNDLGITAHYNAAYYQRLDILDLILNKKGAK